MSFIDQPGYHFRAASASRKRLLGRYRRRSPSGLAPEIGHPNKPESGILAKGFAWRKIRSEMRLQSHETDLFPPRCVRMFAEPAGVLGKYDGNPLYGLCGGTKTQQPT